MLTLNYSVLFRTDGVEEWEDFKAEGSNLDILNQHKKELRDIYKGRMIVFEDIFDSSK